MLALELLLFTIHIKYLWKNSPVLIYSNSCLGFRAWGSGVGGSTVFTNIILYI